MPPGPQDPTPCVNSVTINGQQICGRLGYNTIGDVINRVLAFILPVAGIMLFLVLVWGGFQFLTSAGNPEKVKSAQAKLTSAIIGFFILVFAFAATKIVSYILGFERFF